MKDAFGLPLGSRCPIIMDTAHPFLNLVTQKMTDSPTGKPRLMVGGPSKDKEWVEVVYLSCPSCGLKFASLDYGRDTLDIVESKILANGWPLVAELVDDLPADELNTINKQRFEELFGEQKVKPHACLHCAHRELANYDAKLLPDRKELGHTMIDLLREYRHARKRLTNTYEYCTQCLTVQPLHYWPMHITQSQFQKFLDHYVDDQDALDIKTPTNLLQLRNP